MDKILQELRRGAIILAVLSQLREERYGYSLRERLSGLGFEVLEGTLYPLLRRLEAQELVVSRWEVGESRPRRYYHLSQEGEKALAGLIKEWSSLVEVIDRLIKE
ncbi:MAG: PadR family transcriptional regulator [Anaerolineae bacterium]|nr:PadR family transcriptional regulator [Anaerolineae bacterium]